MVNIGNGVTRETVETNGRGGLPGQSAPVVTEGTGSDWLGGVKVSVVIPAKEEAANLPHVLPRIPKWVHEVILVDGDSTDGTIEVAREIWPTIRVVNQEGSGKGAALRTGFKHVTGDIIVMLDADGSTDPAEIPAFVGALLAGADFVKGSRFLQGGGSADITLDRRLGNWALTDLVKVMFGGNFTDLCYGYNAFWAWVVQVLNLEGDGFEIETEMNIRALQAGLRVAEVPSFEAPRINGESRLQTIPDGLRVLRTILKEKMTQMTSPAAPNQEESAPATEGVLAPAAVQPVTPAGDQRPSHAA